MTTLNKFNLYKIVSKLQIGQPFVIRYNAVKTIDKYNDYDYVIYIRTNGRIVNNTTFSIEYKDYPIATYNVENFFENYFGLDSNKYFESLDDPELNLLFAIRHGKTVSEIPILFETNKEDI